MYRVDYTDLLGRRFRYGGRGPECYDCYGLVMEVYRRFGIQLPDCGTASTPAEIDAMIKEFSRHWVKIRQPEIPSVVAFYIRRPYVSHLGVVIGPDRFIHIMQRSLVTVERLSSPVWRHRIAGFYRWAG